MFVRQVAGVRSPGLSVDLHPGLREPKAQEHARVPAVFRHRPQWEEKLVFNFIIN